MRTTRALAASLACLVLLAGPFAFAQRQSPPPPEERRSTPFEWRLSAGAGISELAGDEIGDLADIGGAWNVRVTFDTENWLSWEAAYVGTANDIQALGLDSDTYLMSNGVEGTAHLNLGKVVDRLADTRMPFNPYLMAGGALVVYDLVNDDFNTSNVRDDDNTFQVPLGAGVSAELGDLALDTRFTWRTAYDSDLLLPPAPGLEAPDASLDNWALSANAGLSF